jgi:hypothetical protein
VWISWLTACGGDGGKDGVPPVVPIQGIVATVRTLTGEPFLAAGVVAGGGNDAEPDSQSTTYFYDLAPGRAAVVATAEGHAWAAGVPRIAPDSLTATDLRPIPVDEELVTDGAAGGHLVFGAVDLTLPAGGLVDDEGAAVTGPVTWRVLEGRAGQREGLPGDRQLLSNDDVLTYVDVFSVFFVEGTTEAGLGVQLADGVTAPVTVALPAGSGAFEARTVRTAAFSRSRAYWSSTGAGEVDAGAGTFAGDVLVFGWTAVMAEAAVDSCVVGTIAGGTGPVVGAEVRVAREGELTLDRASSDDRGEVCLAGGGEIVWSVLGYAPDLSAMYTGSGTATIDAAGFVLAVDTWPDADGDKAFAGPGGDCDDADPSISPNPDSGDGSWCGSDW